MNLFSSAFYEISKAALLESRFSLVSSFTPPFLLLLRLLTSTMASKYWYEHIVPVETAPVVASSFLDTDPASPSNSRCLAQDSNRIIVIYNILCCMHALGLGAASHFHFLSRGYGREDRLFGHPPCTCGSGQRNDLQRVLQ